jgi:hypothetical protein
VDACRSCGAPIRWVVTTSGKRMPLDPAPHVNGNVVPLRDRLEKGRDPIAMVLPHPPTDQPAWLSHFATCANATQHRRGA